MGNIDAVFFDMDGTLLDSEPLTELAISKLLHRFEISDTLDATQFHGVTWKILRIHFAVCIQNSLMYR